MKANKRLVTMIECPECGMGIRPSYTHGCNPDVRRKYIDSLRSRCEKLAVQARRYKAAVERRDKTIRHLQRVAEIEADQSWHCHTTAIAERDWAGRQVLKLQEETKRLTAENTAFVSAIRLENVNTQRRMDRHSKLTADHAQLKISSDNIRIRLETERDTARQSLREFYAESYGLRSQLATARNDALDEAIRILSDSGQRCSGGIDDVVLDAAVDVLDNLKP